MLTYNELIELRNKLASAEIELELAKSQCWNDFKEGNRSWHTEDWKERRAEIIKDKCEICSSQDTLTLQHHSHPRKYSDYLNDITKAYTKEHIGNNPKIDRHQFQEYILLNYDYVPVPLCPNCKKRKPNIRATKSPKYLCTGCRHEFERPVHKSVEDLVAIFYEHEEAIEIRDKCFVSKDKWQNKHNLSNVRYWLQRGMAKNEAKEAIENEAFLLYLNDTIKYLSFEDAITACKRCAYNFDIKKWNYAPNAKYIIKVSNTQLAFNAYQKKSEKLH